MLTHRPGYVRLDKAFVPIEGHPRMWEPSVGEDGFVAQDAVEGGAGDGELAGGAELVAAVQVEHVLNMMADDRIQGEAVGSNGLGQVGLRLGAGGDSEVTGTDDAVDGFEQCRFEDRGG